MRRLLSLSAGLIISIMVIAGGAGVVLAQVTMTPLPSHTPAGRYMFATVPPPKTCGTLYVPCGPLPFRSLGFPTLSLPSSTPIPTLPTNTPVPITATPTSTETSTATATYTPGGPTLTPTATATELGGIDISGVHDLSSQVRTLSAQLMVQVTQSVEVGGTPVGINGIVEALASNVAKPFSFIKGTQEALAPFGMIGAIISFFYFAAVFFLFVRLSTMAIPAVMGLINLVLRIISVIKPF